MTMNVTPLFSPGPTSVKSGSVGGGHDDRLPDNVSFFRAGGSAIAISIHTLGNKEHDTQGGSKQKDDGKGLQSRHVFYFQDEFFICHSWELYQ